MTLKGIIKVLPSPWTPLHDRLHKTLRQRRLLSKQQRILVAVSGGQDSLCLIRVLLDLQPKWNWELAIAHCNHRWRTDSNANADYVLQLAQEWNIAGYCVTAETTPTSEAAARHWRYEVLANLAETHQFTCVVTGHTASDRAETLLYNLIRGSGADGLQALTWQRELIPGVQLVRPLLEITRSITAQFCQAAQLKVWQDLTNDDWSYARNRIRHDLLPYLQAHFNPQVEQALAQTAELLRAEVDFLETAAQQLRSQASIPRPEAATSTQTTTQELNRTVLSTAPLALQRRVMRQVLQKVMSTAPTFEQVEKLTHLITAPNHSRTDPFPGGATAEVEDDWILIS